jgi:hypothetical protein
VLGVLAALLVAGLAATGCVSMPSGGPVASYPVTQGTAAQNQPYVQIQPKPPGANWTPEAIVEGFLTASASWGSYPQVVREYLTPEARNWNPGWSAYVYKKGPTPAAPTYSPNAKNPTKVTIGITGTVQATLAGYGTYSVPSSTGGGSTATPDPFVLVKQGGQWRISSAPQELLLTHDSFSNDYQLRNLYFFDPMSRFLVPDPVYVPVPAKPNDLMDGLVNELMTPPTDWLSIAGATKTAFPSKTKVSSVTLEGVTAVVNLTGANIGKASNEVMEQVSAQLLWTLKAAGTSSDATGQVKSVEVVVNGTPWKPRDNQGQPVQTNALWGPALGKSDAFYYVTSAGYLTSRTADGKTVSITKIGTGYSQIAVSADGTYLAAMRGHTLYTGLVGGHLAKRGTNFVAMSWDADDDLWASEGDQIVMFRGTQGARQPLDQVVPVSVGQFGTFTALQVAPDGVRVAIVIGNNELTFGAISDQSQDPKITPSLVQENLPLGTNFTSLTWYGPDDVITLAQPGPTVTDYLVNGGTSTPVQADQDMRTITASWGQPLVAGLQSGGMKTDASPTGSWTSQISDGDTPVNGISPIYPG